MIKTISTFLVMMTVLFSSCGQRNNHISSKKPESTSQILSRKIIVSDGCDGCDLMYQGMPSTGKLDWATTVTGSTEPGGRMEISGKIYKADGKTPAAGILLYIYHTNAKGYYSPSDTQTLAKRHGHLRSWMMTNNKGEYKFTTIRPGQYPNADIPAHIHPIIKEPNKIEYYIDEFVFDDDLKLTPEKKNKLENRGGSGIMHLTKNETGEWVGHRDIVLGLNIPNYK
ncbi:MAG: hypothetical protein ABI834_01745 [Ginsengibacter sp.]